MAEELISVIVPIYKVEKYLPTCIESIIIQSYRNFELILVDDGSPDLCPDICEEYKLIDSRIKVIHKKNGGLSDARNVGLKEAKGKWVTFIDSDDYVGPNFLKELLLAAIQYKADISICDYRTVIDDTGQEKESSSFLEFDNIECLKNMYHPQMHGMEFVAWGKLYRTDLFTNFQIEYPVGKLHEDIFTTYKLLDAASQIVFSKYIGYFYRIRENSIMTSAFNLKRLSILDAREEACEFFLASNKLEVFELSVNAYFREFVMLYSELSKDKSTQELKQERNNLIHRYCIALKKYMKISNMDIEHRMFYRMFAIFSSPIYKRFLR